MSDSLSGDSSVPGGASRPGAVTRVSPKTLTALLYLVVAVSGFAGLGYQMAWTLMLTVSLGHEFAAVLAVVSAFFVGLALGGLLLNDRLHRTARPGYWYVGLELVIGLWALLLVALLPAYNAWTAQLIGTDPGPAWHWSVAFGATLIALLPATLAMGATLPAAERVAQALQPGTRRIAGLYGANTAGAMLGTLVATFALLPAFGLSKTVLVFALLNFALAIVIWIAAGRRQASAARVTPGMPADSRLFAVLFATGLLGLGYEVLVIRVLSQVLEGTVYTFAAVLTIYLLGTAVGAALYQRRFAAASPDPAGWSIQFQSWLAATALACLAGTLLLWTGADVYQTIYGSAGPGNLAAMLAELGVAACVFLLPTICMGALFSHLAQRVGGAQGLGAALGFNTLGAALAPLLFGVLLLPALGARETLALVVLGYLALLLPKPAAPRRRSVRLALPLAACAAALMLAPLPLRFVDTPDGSRIVAWDEGVIAAVAVVEEPDRSRHLKVNNRFTMGGTASRFSDHRQTHLPLLWHGANAERALYLGLGTGITFQAAQYYPNLQATGVELIPEMLPLMPLFGVEIDGAHWPRPPRVLAADARRFVTAEQERYDVIVAEVFHPSRDGAGSLYTVEHFRAIRARLASGGLFCQWLPLFQIDLDTLRLITRSFVEVFPNAQLHLAHLSLRQPLLCLLGGDGLAPFGKDWLLQRVHEPGLQRQLVQLRLNSDFALFGGYLGDVDALRRFAGDGPLNTDDHPRVTFEAPDFVYGAPATPAERLLELIELTATQRGTLLDDATRASDFGRRLEAYWQARDVFLATGVGVKPSSDVRAMLGQTREGLLDAISRSNDFLPALDPLLAMTEALSAVDPAAARELLVDIEAASPGLPEVERLHRRLFGAD